jgi:hypothetical protein
MQKTTKTQLSRIQRMACLAIAGAMKSTATAAMEVLLNLTPLDLLIMAEVRVVLHNVHRLKQPAVSGIEAGLLRIWRDVSDPILDMRSNHTIPVYHYSRTFNVIIDWDYWRKNDPAHPEDALIWFTDGSKADSGIGSGIFGVRPNGSLSFPLGR